MSVGSDGWKALQKNPAPTWFGKLTRKTRYAMEGRWVTAPYCMTVDQAALIALLLGMMGAYASERIRPELVAMCGLAIAFAFGLIPIDTIFAGFSSSAVLTVIEVLIVAGALAPTRLMDGIARRIVSSGARERPVILAICAIGGAVSIFMNNIGALALVFPVATSVCARMGIAPARMLMPLSFATLLGGMGSLTGTPANLVVNQWVVHETGGPLAYFATGVYGLPLLVGGLLLMTVLSPRVFSASVLGNEDQHASAIRFAVERVVSASSSLIGTHVLDWEARDNLRVHSVIRGGVHVFARRADLVLAPSDLVIVEAPLERILELEEAEQLGGLASQSDVVQEPATLEFVVMPESLLVGSRLDDISLYAAGGAEVIALASRRGRIEGRLGDLQLSTGDILVISGARENLRILAAECGLLMLSPRRRLRPNRKGWAGAALFAIGILATAVDLMPTEVAFGAVVIAMAATRQLNLRNALQELNWPIVILLACMIPLGQAVENSGAAHAIANGVAAWLPTGSPIAVAAAMLLIAVLVTPFMDNVSTAAILSPIAAGLATRTGTSPETLLMMVAIGASIDFLTPFGHHNNTVVMGAGHYRFRDFARLGAPLTILCIAIVLCILPLAAR